MEIKLQKTILLGNITRHPQTVMALGCNPINNTSEMEFFNGRIYDAQIYNRALTEDEIRQNYEIDKVRFNIQE